MRVARIGASPCRDVGVIVRMSNLSKCDHVLFGLHTIQEHVAQNITLKVDSITTTLCVMHHSQIAVKLDSIHTASQPCRCSMSRGVLIHHDCLSQE